MTVHSKKQVRKSVLMIAQSIGCRIQIMGYSGEWSISHNPKYHIRNRYRIHPDDLKEFMEIIESLASEETEVDLRNEEKKSHEEDLKVMNARMTEMLNSMLGKIVDLRRDKTNIENQLKKALEKNSA